MVDAVASVKGDDGGDGGDGGGSNTREKKKNAG